MGLSQRRKVREMIKRYKEDRGCLRCGTKDNLTFHHRNPQEKSFNLSRVSCGKGRVMAELEKCDVLCRPCHNFVEHQCLQQWDYWITNRGMFK